jgi:hypothetical protein
MMRKFLWCAATFGDVEWASLVCNNLCSGLSVVGCFFVLKMIGARSATPRCFDGLWCRALSDLEDFGLQIWSDQRPAAGSLLYVNSASWIVTLGTDEDDLRSSRTSTSRNLNTTRLY